MGHLHHSDSPGSFTGLRVAVTGGTSGLGLALVRWEGVYQEVEARWLRWATVSGALLPTPQEVAVETQRQVTEAQRQQAALEALLARYRARFGDLPDAEGR